MIQTPNVIFRSYADQITAEFSPIGLHDVFSFVDDCVVTVVNSTGGITTSDIEVHPLKILSAGDITIVSNVIHSTLGEFTISNGVVEGATLLLKGDNDDMFYVKVVSVVDIYNITTDVNAYNIAGSVIFQGAVLNTMVFDSALITTYGKYTFTFVMTFGATALTQEFIIYHSAIDKTCVVNKIFDDLSIWSECLDMASVKATMNALSAWSNLKALNYFAIINDEAAFNDAASRLDDYCNDTYCQNC